MPKQPKKEKEKRHKGYTFWVTKTEGDLIERCLSGLGFSTSALLKALVLENVEEWSKPLARETLDELSKRFGE